MALLIQLVCLVTVFWQKLYPEGQSEQLVGFAGFTVTDIEAGVGKFSINTFPSGVLHCAG